MRVVHKDQLKKSSPPTTNIVPLENWTFLGLDISPNQKVYDMVTKYG